MALHVPDELLLPERPIDDDADAALLSERQNAGFHLSIEHIVRHLDEIDRLGRHDPLELTMTPPFRRGDADIADLSFRLHGEQCFEVLLPGHEIVHLHQVELGMPQ